MKEFNENSKGINGNEISLDEVLEIARETVERISRKEEDNMEAFSRIVKGVARKYGSVYVDREDLEQELWLTVLELINSWGGADKVDPRLVAKSCYNRAVDYYRYCRRRKDSKAQLIEETESDSNSDSKQDESLSLPKFQTGSERVQIHEIIDLFPEGSRERKYVVTKLYMYGEISEEDELPDKLELPAGDTEADILKILGYNSRYPSSWGKLKYQIRNEIYKYLGILENSEDQASVDSTILKRLEEMTLTSRKNYVDFKRVLRDKAMKLLGCDEAKLLELIETSDKILKSVGPNGDWWALKNDPATIAVFTDDGYKVFER